jgi:hypothetical protein
MLKVRDYIAERAKKWENAIIGFMGNKKQALKYALQALQSIPQKRLDQIEEMYDLFGGGGGWGMALDKLEELFA